MFTEGVVEPCGFGEFLVGGGEVVDCGVGGGGREVDGVRLDAKDGAVVGMERGKRV